MKVLFLLLIINLMFLLENPCNIKAGIYENIKIFEDCLRSIPVCKIHLFFKANFIKYYSFLYNLLNIY